MIFNRDDSSWDSRSVFTDKSWLGYPSLLFFTLKYSKMLNMTKKFMHLSYLGILLQSISTAPQWKYTPTSRSCYSARSNFICLLNIIIFTSNIHIFYVGIYHVHICSTTYTIWTTVLFVHAFSTPNTARNAQNGTFHSEYAAHSIKMNFLSSFSFYFSIPIWYIKQYTKCDGKWRWRKIRYTCYNIRIFAE